MNEGPASGTPDLPRPRGPRPGEPGATPPAPAPDVDYAETGLVASYRLALTSLHDAGAPLRRTRVPT